MLKLKKLFFFILFLNHSYLPYAQNTQYEKCGHLEATQKIYQTFPELKPGNNPAHQILQQETHEHRQNNIAQAPLLTIPIVIHVVHDNGPENLTDEEIIDGIALLNEDFRALNEEIPNEIHPSFLNIVADSEMEFQIACLDPDGNATNGITRTVSNYTYAGDDVQMKYDIRWPRDKYMNIWLVNKPFANSSSSGFAYYPPTVDDPSSEVYDGVVIAYWAYGRHDETAVGYEHVLSHEVGHWANLKHTWGDQSDFGTNGACDDDDEVNDTPNTWGHAFFGDCTLETFSCGTLDNNNNFMDYTGTCTGMFTFGQKDRMRAALNSSVAGRSNLWSTANLAATICAPTTTLLIYTNNSIEEDLANDGTINGTINVEARNFIFSQNTGNFTAGIHYNITGLPSGLSAIVAITSDTTLTINVSGITNPHADADDLAFSIQFTDAAFNNILAADIIGSIYSNLQINFLDPYRVVCVDIDDPHAEILGQTWEPFSLNYGDAAFGTWLYGNESLKLETYDKGAICIPGTRHIQPLASASYIGPNSTFTIPDPYPNQLDISNPSYTDWNGQIAYIGFEFQNVGRIHYGWLRANVTENGTRFTVTDGAYNTEPFVEIYAGDCGDGIVPQVIYYPHGVVEGIANNGNINADISANVENTTLSQSNGSFTEGVHYTVSGLPVGLSLTINVLSENKIAVAISGAATNHADIDDTNFNISFLDAAFNGTLAANVTNVNYNLFVDFLDPYGIECIDLPDPYAEVGGQEWEYFTLDYGDGDFGTWLYNGDMLKLETYAKGAICYENTRNIQPLSGSFSVGPASSFTIAGAYPDQLDISNVNYTNWNGYTGYIGIRISNNGNYHYGWLHASVNPAGTIFTVLDGAYNTQPNAAILTGDCTGSPLAITPFVTEPTCYGGSDGTADIIVAGGIPPYNYTWSNGATASNITELAAGTYALTIADSNNNTNTISVIITNPEALELTFETTATSSGTAMDGTIELSVAQGTAPYTFNWSNGATTKDLTGLSIGNYSVIVIDANDCIANGSVTITAPNTGNYCDAITLLDANWISNVRFAQIDNSSAWDGNGYSDYTAQIATVAYGESHSLTLNFDVEYWGDIAAWAWIDWNQNGNFDDPGEEVYGFRGEGPFTTDVIVPVDAVSGSTRMRVRLGYGKDLDPCETDNYQGEVEDYTINIQEANGYCPAITLLDNNWVSNVNFAQINNTSAWDHNGYSDYTSLAAIVLQGDSQSLTISLDIEYWPDIAVWAWIDWNQNGDFSDPGEEVYGFRGEGPYSVLVSVPNDATLGITRMRVRTGYGTDLVPCETDTYQGEVEDYTIYISSPEPTCETDMNITTDYNNGDNYQEQVSNRITAYNIIKTGADVIYDAGIDILLDAGFEVQAGAIFEAKIGGCENE